MQEGFYPEYTSCHHEACLQHEAIYYSKDSAGWLSIVRVNLAIVEVRFIQTTCVKYRCNILAVRLYVATVLFPNSARRNDVLGMLLTWRFIVLGAFTAFPPS